MHKLELKYIKYDENLSSKERHQLEHDSAYSLLFNMLKTHFNITSPTVKKTETGKPYIDNSNIHFSLSHTDGLVVCVVADSPVGVDCEKLSSRSNTEIQKFANRFFVENEINFLKNNNYSTLDFFKVWTGKEATIKKLGTTMSDIKNIDTTKENILVSIKNEYIISINI